MAVKAWRNDCQGQISPAGTIHQVGGARAFLQNQIVIFKASVWQTNGTTGWNGHGVLSHVAQLS